MRISMRLKATAYKKFPRRVMYCFALAVGLFLLLLGEPRLLARWQEEQSSQDSRGPFEVQLSKPLHWVNGCLSISLNRINHSSVPLFLPDMGLYISTSARDASKLSGQQGGQEWINVYGATDIISWEATKIAAGATVHDEDCLNPQVGVVSLKSETRREIPLRGKLRIDACYFLTANEWQQYKSSREQMFRTPPDQWGKIARHDPHVVTIFAAIPCREAGCAPGCDDPPIILHDENRLIPDVAQFNHDWEARGKKVTDELARQFPPCSVANPPHP
jgi:hypothetical protein